MKERLVKGLPQEARYIREEVFVKEQGFLQEFDDIDKQAYHVVIFDGDKAIATGRTFVEGEYYIIGRVAVLKEYRGKHIGRVIISSLEKKIKEVKGHKIKLSAQVQASGFYEKLGYHRMGAEYLDEHCPHITMIKEI